MQRAERRSGSTLPIERGSHASHPLSHTLLALEVCFSCGWLGSSGVADRRESAGSAEAAAPILARSAKMIRVGLRTAPRSR